MAREIVHLAEPPAPHTSRPTVVPAEAPPGVPALAQARCWCERVLAKLNLASDTAKCIGCGLPSQECTCKPLVGT